MLKQAVVLTDVLLNPLRLKFYVSTHTQPHEGYEKPITTDSK